MIIIMIIIIITIIIIIIITIIIRFASNFPRAVQLCQLRWKLWAYIIDVVREGKSCACFLVQRRHWIGLHDARDKIIDP